MPNIVLYRKDATGPKWNPEQYDRKPTKAQIEEANRHLEYIVRVQRPELLAFLESGFYALPAIAPRVIANRGERLMRHIGDGWTIPDGSLGRNPAHNKSTTQSLILWIKQNCGHLVNPEHVSIVVQ